MVLAYDLSEDRRTIDVIITEFLPLCLKMAGSFENLDTILQGWGKGTKKSYQGIERVREAGKRKIKPLLLAWKDSEEILQQCQ